MGETDRQLNEPAGCFPGRGVSEGSAESNVAH